MRRLLIRGVCAGVIAIGAMACEDTPVPTQPTPETPVTVTDTFNGSLTPNGAATFTFTVAAAGNVTATLTTLQPNATTAIGLSLGTWSGVACQEVLSKDDAVQGSSIIGAVSTPTTICVRVRDVGKLTAPLTFTLTVLHP